jgi:hypothetical protein
VEQISIGNIALKEIHILEDKVDRLERKTIANNRLLQQDIKLLRQDIQLIHQKLIESQRDTERKNLTRQGWWAAVGLWMISAILIANLIFRIIAG